MDVLVLARLQFAVTTVFHYFFVPVTIGLSLFIAILQTRYQKTGDESEKKLIKFMGKLFLINFAMGVVTGIVQEFQFGMNWSGYARFVGDIFGAPLAVEALLAFFIESTFLGLWVFGWDKLSKKVHLLCIWLAAIATSVSAYIILAANSFMQEPQVGAAAIFNEATGRMELNGVPGFIALVTNPHAAWQWAHVFVGALATTGFLALGFSAYQLIKGRDEKVFQKNFRQGLLFALIGTVMLWAVGHLQGVYVAHQNPMKMAAADGHWNTSDKPDWPIIAIPSKDQGKNLFDIKIPGLLSFLTYNNFSGKEVQGINDLQAQMQEQFPESEFLTSDFVPNVWITFYAFRIMLGCGAAMLLVLALALLWGKPGTLEQRPAGLRLLPFAMALPYIANACGWILAEVGRQPWIVYKMQTINMAVSKVVPAPYVVLSLLGFIVLYSTLTIIAVTLAAKTVREGLDAFKGPSGATAG
ncbi:MAG: cytochrome ubiquinol oxidase subunit I [Treponema sp.]|nr:cytochrome ubiquinol oxidase subunit I [Treponema sp.]